MDLSKVLPAVAVAAPTIAGLLGGPLAGMGVQALENVFGLSPGSTVANGSPAALETAVAGMTPDTAVKLAQVDADLKAKLLQGGIDVQSITEKDRDSARQRAVAMKDHSPIWIGTGLILIWAGINFYLLSSTKPPVVAPELVGRILGMCDAATMAFIYWLYGSSVGSGDKNNIIATLTNKTPR